MAHLSHVLGGGGPAGGEPVAGSVSMARLASAASVLPSMDAHTPHPMAGYAGRKMTSPSQAIARHVLRYGKTSLGGSFGSPQLQPHEHQGTQSWDDQLQHTQG